MRQYLQKSIVKPAMLPASLSGTTASVPLTIDRKGFDSAIITCNCAVNSAGNASAALTLKLYEGDTTTPATLVTTDPAAVGTVDVSSSTVAGNKTWYLDLRALKRYIRFTLTPSDMASTTVVAALAVTLGDANIHTQDQVSSATPANGATDEVQAVAATVIKKA